MGDLCVSQEQVSIYAAYGSSRDISIYSTSLQLPKQRVFILGKKPSKSKKADSAQVWTIILYFYQYILYIALCPEGNNFFLNKQTDHVK